jgi:hypothetical protein
MIIGCDLMVELRLQINYKNLTVTWDDSTIQMKDYEALSDLMTPIHDFYWHEESYESQALNDATARIKKILDAKYKPANLNEVTSKCAHLTDDEQAQLNALLKHFELLFDRSLGVWHNKPYDIELKEGVKPYHAKPFPVPKIHEQMLKMELNCLVKAGILKCINHSEWAALMFIIPKKDATV